MTTAPMKPCGKPTSIVLPDGTRDTIPCPGYVTRWGGSRFDKCVPCSHHSTDVQADACPHERLTSTVCDQTIGVTCGDCHALLAHCWMNEHVPESLWNRVCKQDLQLVPCEQSRDDVCSLCSETISHDSQAESDA
jgi:hypothetical protein